MKSYLGIDWGGTYIKAGVVDCRGKILAKKVYSSRELSKKDFFISEIKSLLKFFAKFKVKAIGIGAPGIINIKEGFIYYLPNISGWENFPLKKILEKEVKLPVFIDNDANVFALAQARLGPAKGFSEAIFLTLGTGLGSSVMFNQKILNKKNSALELGHVPVSLEKNPCGCGNYGCIETFLGNKYLVKKYNKLNKKKLVKTVKDIYLLALKKDKTALLIWDEFSFYLGRFLAGMINIFNPQVIVIGGGLSGAYSLFKPKMVAVIKQQTMWPNLKNLKIKKTGLQNAGIIGAGLLAKEKTK